ncbi:MAG: DUF4202 family protein [Desulfobacterales bacterium]|nr:DUF4202 family protein [Desulfobacterales bacterium]
MGTGSIECTKRRIRAVVAGSLVPEDARHAENTLDWLLRLKPDADDTLQIAALGHDIERSLENRKAKQADFADHDGFKAAHARNSAKILKEIMEDCGVPQDLAGEVFRLVCRHETGGDLRADLIKDADSISFFEVNLPLYYKRHTRKEVLQRCVWGYRRLSERMQKLTQTLSYDNAEVNALLKEAIRKASQCFHEKVSSPMVDKSQSLQRCCIEFSACKRADFLPIQVILLDDLGIDVHFFTIYDHVDLLGTRLGFHILDLRNKQPSTITSLFLIASGAGSVAKDLAILSKLSFRLWSVNKTPTQGIAPSKSRLHEDENPPLIKGAFLKCPLWQRGNREDFGAALTRSWAIHFDTLTPDRLCPKLSSPKRKHFGL